MKESKGKANPGLLNKILLEKLNAKSWQCIDRYTKWPLLYVWTAHVFSHLKATFITPDYALLQSGQMFVPDKA